MYEFLDRRYAQALYDVAEKKGRVQETIDDLSQLVELLENSEEVKKLVHHPEISVREKKKFFIQLLKGRMDEDLITFVLILVEKDRILYLKEKLEELKKIDLEHRAILLAQVKTARPLKDFQRQAILDKLTEKYGKRVELKETLDPDLLGGMILKVGDDLMDGSLKSRFEDLREAMLAKIEANEL